jgi:hypothetical protein
MGWFTWYSSCNPFRVEPVCGEVTQGSFLFCLDLLTGHELDRGLSAAAGAVWPCCALALCARRVDWSW